jgi:hypothetical protein
VPQLANIFDPVTDRARGRDLRHSVVLSRGDLGAPCTVEVPMRLATETGELVDRSPGPSDDGEHIKLNLPRDVPLPVTLRLRGLGEVRVGGDPGDLYLEVREGAALPSRGDLGVNKRALFALGVLLLFALSALAAASVLDG